jgi:hypothetical protein
MDALAERSALIDVVLRHGPNLDSFDRPAARLAHRHGRRLLDVKAERLVQAERAHVERVLKQPDARRVLPALDHGLHQLPPDAGVLARWIDRDRTDPADRAALVDEVRADHTAIDFRDHAPYRRMPDPRVDHPARGLEHRKVTLEAMVVVDATECVEDDLRQNCGIVRRRLAERDLFGGGQVSRPV